VVERNDEQDQEANKYEAGTGQYVEEGGAEYEHNDEDGEVAAYGEEQTYYGEDYDDCDGGQEDYYDKGENSY